MKYNNTLIFKTLNDYKKMLENKGYNVIYIGLYGSQNYNLDYMLIKKLRLSLMWKY